MTTIKLVRRITSFFNELFLEDKNIQTLYISALVIDAEKIHSRHINQQTVGYEQATVYQNIILRLKNLIDTSLMNLKSLESSLIILVTNHSCWLILDELF